MRNPDGAAFSISSTISLHGAPRATRALTASMGTGGTACSYCRWTSSGAAGTSTVRRFTEYDVAAGAVVLMMVTPQVCWSDRLRQELPWSGRPAVALLV